MGTRQLSQVIGTIKNMPRIDELTGIANNSSGAAMDAQLIWAESLEAKLQGLTNASQIFWQTFINTDAAKGFVDMLTSIVEGATGLVETFGGVGVAVGTLTAAFVMFTNNPIKAFLGNMSGLLLKVASSFIKTGSAGMAGAALMDMFTFANVRATLATIATTFAVTALQIALTAGLALAVMAIIGGVVALCDALVMTDAELKEFNEDVTKTSQATKEQINSTTDLTKKMSELEKEIANSDNSEEQAKKKKELLDVQAEIAKILPEAATGYDAEGRAIATNAKEVEALLDLKRQERRLNADEFFETNKNMSQSVNIYKQKKKQYEEMLKAQKDGKKYSVTYDKVEGNGRVTKVKQEYEVNTDQLKAANKELSESNKLFAQAKVHIDAYKSAGMSDSQISEMLGFDIEMLNNVSSSADDASSSIDGLGNSGNGASEGLEQVVVKIGNISVNAENAKEKIDALADAFGQFSSDAKIAEKALEEFNKYGKLTEETKAKILTSGNTDMQAALRDNKAFADEMPKIYEKLKKSKEDASNSIIGTAYAKKLQDEKEAIDKQNKALDEQKGKVEGVNKAKEASAKIKNENEAQDYSKDVNAKTTAEQNKTKITNEESDKRKTKLTEEGNTPSPDVENKTQSEQQKTATTTEQSNARIAEGNKEAAQNKANYDTDGNNYKLTADGKLVATQGAMVGIDSSISTGMSGLATHYNTNAINFSSSLASMQGAASGFASGINAILSTIKMPELKMPSIPGASGGGKGNGGASTQSLDNDLTRGMVVPTREMTNLSNEFKGNVYKNVNTKNKDLGEIIKASVKPVVAPNVINPTVTDEEKRRSLHQLETSVKDGIMTGMERSMLGLPRTASVMKTVTLDPNKVVGTVKPSSDKKNPTSSKKKKPPSSSGSKSSGSSKSKSNSSKDKVDIKDIEDEIDRYKALKDHLKDIDHYLSMNEKRSKRATGKDKYKHYYEELMLLERKKKAIESIQKAQQKEMSELEKKLQSNGFHAMNGDIANVKDRLEKLKNEANAMADNNKAKEAAKKKYEDLKKASDRYFEVSDDLQQHKEQWEDVVNEIKDAQIEMEEKAASEVEAIRDKLVDALKAKYEEMREADISDLDKEIEALQKKLDDMDKKADDKQGRLAKLKQQMADWEKDDSSLGKSKVEELKEQIAELEGEIARDAINEEIDKLEKEKEKVDEHYDKLLADKNIYDEANKLLAEGNQAELLKLLEQYAPDYAFIGELWGKNFADEFKKQLQEAKDALDFLQGKIKDEKPVEPSKPPSPPPKPPSGGGGNSKPPNNNVAKGNKVKVTNESASIYASSSTSKSSGNWAKTLKAIGTKTLYVANMSGSRVALSPNGKFPATGWIDKKYVAKFSKGGMTGDWNGMDGKYAMLHQNEAILNKDQAKIFTDNKTAIKFEKFVDLLANASMPRFDKDFGKDNVEQTINIENNINISGNASTLEMKRKGVELVELINKELRKSGVLNKK